MDAENQTDNFLMLASSNSDGPKGKVVTFLS